MAAEALIEDRRERMSQLISVKGFTPMTELVQQFGVSESTVRRDLEVLEEQGVVRRTYGGAVFVKDTAETKLAFSDRETTALAEKQAIAQAVCDLVSVNQAVLINGGTTCREIARMLIGKRISVVTNSVPIASLLWADPVTEVTLIGGYVYPRTGVALGATAVDQLATVNAAKVILSCAGVTEDGAFNVNQMMVEVERKMMEVADEVILAVDHTKLGTRSVAKLCDFAEVDAIVTDAGVEPADREWLDARARTVIYAEPTGDGDLETIQTKGKS